MENDIEMNDISTKNSKNSIHLKNKIFPVFHPIQKSSSFSSSYILSKTEARLKNDLIEIQTKRLTTNNYKIIINDYKKDINNLNKYFFTMDVEFKNYFQIRFIFNEDYPFSPPIIYYINGIYIKELFDKNNNLKLNCLNKEKWSPVLGINTILFSIELLLDTYIKNLDINTYNKKIKQRNFKTFYNQSKIFFNDGDEIYKQFVNDTQVHFKKLKIN
jgi:ubiquitin-protein ligase